MQVLADLSYGVFATDAALQKFCDKRPLLLEHLLRTLACGKDRFTEIDFTTACDRIFQDAGTDVMGMTSMLDIALRPDVYCFAMCWS